MPLAVFELTLVGFTVFVDHDSIADIVELEPAFKGRTIFELV